MKVLELTHHGSPEAAFALRIRPDPDPGPGQVRVRVEASGVNFADVLTRRGAYAEAPRPPCVIGYEVVGHIDALGPGVAQDPEAAALVLGQRVLAFTRFGGYASCAVTSVHGTVPISEDLDPGAAASLATQGVTAYFATHEMVGMARGDLVLVQAAAGGVGNLIVQLARAQGAVVAGTAGSDAKLDLLRKLGVTYAINYRTHDFASELLRLSWGRRPDLIFDSIGGATARKGFLLLATGGRIVNFGVADLAGGGWALPRAVRAFLSFGWIHPLALMLQSKGIVGVNLLRIADERPEIVRRDMQAMLALAASGALTPVVDRAFPAERVAEAHEYVESRRSMGKVVLRWEE
jgi:NADPH2:quinone reductase